MQRREAIGVLGAAAVGTGAVMASVRDQFIGVYRLVSYQRKAQDGTITDVYGPTPIGRITYDAAGRMSGFLMRPNRGRPKDPRTPTVEEYREIQSGFVAYMGTFDVDEASKTVTHHVEAALNPAWPGTDLKRTYEFAGNRLTLSVAGPTSLKLVWERQPDR